MEQESPHLGRCGPGKAELGETICSHLLPCMSPSAMSWREKCPRGCPGLPPPRALTPHTLLLGPEPRLGAMGGYRPCPLEMLWWMRCRGVGRRATSSQCRGAERRATSHQRAPTVAGEPRPSLFLARQLWWKRDEDSGRDTIG